MQKLLPAIAIIAFAWFAVSCGGGGDGDKVVVGAEGGVVTSDDSKLTLDIPAGALDEEVGITITTVSVDDLPEALREASGSGPAYRLEPDGLEFDEPVPVTLELGKDDLPEDQPENGTFAYQLVTQDEDGELEFLDELVTEASLADGTVVVRGKLDHFSIITTQRGTVILGVDPGTIRIAPDNFFTVRIFFFNLAHVENELGPSGFGLLEEGQVAVSLHDVVLQPFYTRSVVDGLPVSFEYDNFLPGFGNSELFTYFCEEGEGTYGATMLYDMAPLDHPEGLRMQSIGLFGDATCAEAMPTDTPVPTSTPAPGATNTPVPGVATSAPQSKPTPEPVPTSTPVPPPPTNTPVPTTHTDPPGDEIVVGGGSDAVVDIRSVTIGPSGSQTKVFVTFGGDPSEAYFDDLSFAVRVTLGGQVGLLEIHNDVVNDAPPAGGSVNVTSNGVSIIFNKPVPSGVKLLVESFHLETESSPFGSDRFTVMLP